MIIAQVIDDNHSRWYRYRNNIKESINGVLGVMEYIYKIIDMIESHRFLGTLFENEKKPISALDSGGGIWSNHRKSRDQI